MNASIRIVAALAVIWCLALAARGLADDAPPNPSAPALDTGVQELVAKAKEAEKRLDFNAAASWYEKAAELGDSASMNELGWIYFGAHDIPGRHFQDYSKAAFWFQKAADLNNVHAITQLGVMYGSDGSFGVPQDHIKAAQLFLKAAEMGDPQAMNNLGFRYSRGDGVPRDMDQAVRWWKRAVAIDGPTGISGGQAAQSWLRLLGIRQEN